MSADQINHLQEQIGYLRQALAFEIADGKKARDKIAILEQEVTLLRALVKFQNPTDKDSLTTGATAEESSVDHFRDFTKKVRKEVQA